MKLQWLIQQVFYEPALITPEAHASIRKLLEDRLQLAEPFAREPGKGVCGEEVAVEQMEVIDGIAHIPIGGAIGQKLKPIQRGEGAVDVLEIAQELDQAEADDEVRGILLDIDSPGGMVTGTPELAKRIGAVKKPIYAYTNGLMASAAYWLGSAAQAVFASETAYIGSIGVYVPVYDLSGWYAAKGIKVELIKAGKLKGTGYPGTSLSEGARDHLQTRVNQIYAMFTGHVRERRGDVASDTMQGQTFLATEAAERGLIDGVVESKKVVLEYLGA